MPRTTKVNFDAIRFGQIVRRLRSQRHWTLRKVAQRAGVTPQYLAIVDSRK